MPNVSLGGLRVPSGNASDVEIVDDHEAVVITVKLPAVHPGDRRMGPLSGASLPGGVDDTTAAIGAGRLGLALPGIAGSPWSR